MDKAEKGVAACDLATLTLKHLQDPVKLVEQDSKAPRDLLQNDVAEQLGSTVFSDDRTLQLLAEHHARIKCNSTTMVSSDNRALTGESGDARILGHRFAQSLASRREQAISHAEAIKPLIYVLKTGTETSKKNAACALLSLALVDDNKISIGACGVIPPLVSLLINSSNRGEQDALMTLYKLCSVKVNKERAVSRGGEATGGVSVEAGEGVGGGGDGGVE
ncbi:hypothetical protein LguiA_005076 [Lonicera macranthoides]